MAKVLASRAHSDEALQARLERAAARFSSIHARWAAVGNDASLAAPASVGAQPPAIAAGSGGQGDLALPISGSGVCVTPILGIAAVADDEPRPRFKTLMGVPREEADADGPGSESTPAASPARASSSSDTARLKRPAPPPLPDPFLALPEAAPAPWQVPGGRSTAPEQVARQTLPPGAASTTSSALARSSPDIAAERASLRRSQRRRSWLVGVGSFAATLAVFAIAAPRERALAARWLRDEYQVRVQPSLRTVVDSVRALKPVVVEPGEARPSLSEKSALVGAAAEARRIEEPITAADLRPDPTMSAPPATAAPAMEVVSEPASPRTAAPVPSPASSLPSRELGERDSTARTQAKSQVAAPRKRSTRAAEERATAAEMKPRAARATKARAARQNSPRRTGNGGIIRETPF